MPATFEIPKVEQPELDPQELLKRMTSIPETRGALRKTLSGENVRSFLEIIASPEAVEADWLYNCGDLTREHVNQYRVVTGNYQTCVQKLRDLAIKISNDFRPNLVELIENDMRGQKKEGVYNLLDSLHELYEIGLKLELRRGLGADSAGFGERFLYQVYALVGSDLIDIMYDKKVNGSVRIKIWELIECYRKIFREKYGMDDFPGVSFHLEKIELIKVFEKEENLISLDKLINFSSKYNEDEHLRMSEEKRNFVAAINKEESYKMIPLITLNDSDPQIIAVRNHPDLKHSHEDPCNVYINFGKEMMDFPSVKIEKSGFVNSIFLNKLPDAGCTLNIKNGDLCFITSGLTGGIQLNDQIISTDRYLALQNFILHKIKDYLENKEPDIEDLFIYSPSDLKAINERIEDEAKARQPAELLHEYAQEPNEDQVEIESVQFIYNKEDLSSQESIGNKFVLPKHFRAAIMDRISGAKAKEIIAALRRMLGKEEKTDGDHLFFRSQRNGLALPIPLHSQNDRHHISLPLILSMLKLWKYNPIELALELGLKIPKRLMSEL